jgi:hypothetical protein
MWWIVVTVLEVVAVVFAWSLCAGGAKADEWQSVSEMRRRGSENMDQQTTAAGREVSGLQEAS